MAVSTSLALTLTALGEVTVAEGPCMITSVVVTELSGTAPAFVTLTGHSDPTPLMSFAVLAGQTANWAGEPVAAGSGLVIACPVGDALVTVAYR